MTYRNMKQYYIVQYEMVWHGIKCYDKTQYNML